MAATPTMRAVRQINLETSCADCGADVSVDSRKVTLMLDPVEEGSPPSGTWWFRCPWCRVTTRKPADGLVIGHLRSAGVVPINAVPATRRGDGPTIDWDDVIEFGRSLEAGGNPWTELGKSSLPG